MNRFQADIARSRKKTFQRRIIREIRIRWEVKLLGLSKFDLEEIYKNLDFEACMVSVQLWKIWHRNGFDSPLVDYRRKMEGKRNLRYWLANSC